MGRLFTLVPKIQHSVCGQGTPKVTAHLDQFWSGLIIIPKPYCLGADRAGGHTNRSPEPAYSHGGGYSLLKLHRSLIEQPNQNSSRASKLDTMPHTAAFQIINFSNNPDDARNASQAAYAFRL